MNSHVSTACPPSVLLTPAGKTSATLGVNPCGGWRCECRPVGTVCTKSTTLGYDGRYPLYCDRCAEWMKATKKEEETLPKCSK